MTNAKKEPTAEGLLREVAHALGKAGSPWPWAGDRLLTLGAMLRGRRLKKREILAVLEGWAAGVAERERRR